MEYCRNRSQSKQLVKLVCCVLIVSIIVYWIVRINNRPHEETPLATSTDSNNTHTKQISTVSSAYPEKELKTCEPSISVRKMGQFGNQIWEYISLYVVWQMNMKLLKQYYLTPFIDEDMKENLETLFENLSIQAFPTIYQFQCNERDTFILPKEKPFYIPTNMNKKNILLDSYSARYEDAIKFGIDNVKKELRFKEHYVDEIMQTLEEIRAKYYQNNETTFIGMHYRGGDYIPHLVGRHGQKFKGPPNYSYYTTAMDYFKAKYDNVVFIFITIDHDWLFRNGRQIQDNGIVIVNPFYNNDRNKDLTLLSHCNHSIINYGTFGVTTALFAQGETILYDLDLRIDYRGDTVALGISKVLPNWILRKNSHEDDDF